MSQRLALLKGDDSEQGVACEREIESRVWPSMAVAVFLPSGSVAFVVVAVFDAPVLAGGSCGARFIFDPEAGEEYARVALGGALWVFFRRPFALHGDCRPGAEESRIDRRDTPNSGFTGIDATMIAFGAQVKKGAFFKACAAASSRLEVFSLVPMR